MDERRGRWQERTDPDRTEQQREWDAERQRSHRMLKQVKPREPAPMMPDPLALSDEGLLNLQRIRSSLRNAHALGLLERTEEILRRLGWGPDDEPEKGFEQHSPR